MNMAPPQDPIPVRGQQIRVIVPREVGNNLEQLQKTLANVMGRLGCARCTSGYDLRLIQECDFVVNAKTLAPEGLSAIEQG